MLDKTKTAMGGACCAAGWSAPWWTPWPSPAGWRPWAGWWTTLWSGEELAQVLREITDLERLISRVVYGTAGAGTWSPWPPGWPSPPLCKTTCPKRPPSLLAKLRRELEGLPEVTGLIARGIVDEPPFSVREGGFIRAGYDADVDQLRELLTDTKGLSPGWRPRRRRRPASSP